MCGSVSRLRAALCASRHACGCSVACFPCPPPPHTHGPQLFLKVRASLTRCVRMISRGQTLLSLTHVFEVRPLSPATCCIPRLYPRLYNTTHPSAAPPSHPRCAAAKPGPSPRVAADPCVAAACLHNCVQAQRKLSLYCQALHQRLPKTALGQTSVSPPYQGVEWFIKVRASHGLGAHPHLPPRSARFSCVVAGSFARQHRLFRCGEAVRTQPRGECGGLVGRVRRRRRWWVLIAA